MNYINIPLTGKYGFDKLVMVSPEDFERLDGRRYVVFHLAML